MTRVSSSSTRRARIAAIPLGRAEAAVDVDKIEDLILVRRILAERIAAGTAAIVLGDAAALPWEDGRPSAVTSADNATCGQAPGRPRTQVAGTFNAHGPGPGSIRAQS